MNIVAIRKSTGMFLESHELGFDRNTLMQNALSCGFNEDDIEIKELSNSELDVILKAEHNATLTYADNRKAEYPSIGDQLDALYHAGTFDSTMTATIKAVKDKYPKE